jgi:anti-sigma-K factor RskA
LVAAAAVAVLVGGGTAGYAYQQHRVDAARTQAAAAERRDAARQAQQARLATLLAAPDATLVERNMPDGTRIRLITSARLDEAAVYLSGLAATPAGRTYQLWWLSGATAVDEGVLAPGRGSFSAVLTGVRGKDAFGMSIEPVGGSPAPTHVYAAVPLA